MVVVQGSNPGKRGFLRTRPNLPRDPPSLLYNGYRVFPGGKEAGAWCWPPTPSRAEFVYEVAPHRLPSVSAQLKNKETNLTLSQLFYGWLWNMQVTGWIYGVSITRDDGLWFKIRTIRQVAKVTSRSPYNRFWRPTGGNRGMYSSTLSLTSALNGVGC
jgi:hypothetical protein